MPWSAVGAEPAEDKFAFAKNALAESAGSGLGHVVPLDVFHSATTIANEVVMADTFGIEASGTAFDGHFTDQASLHQVPQIVIGCLLYTSDAADE